MNQSASFTRSFYYCAESEHKNIWITCLFLTILRGTTNILREDKDSLEKALLLLIDYSEVILSNI